MNYLLSLALVALAALPPQDAARASTSAPVAAARPSGIAAKINGEIITWDDVELYLRSVPPEQRTPELRHQTLRHLAERALFLQEAKKYGITVTEAQIDGELEAQRKRAKYTPEEFQHYINSVENMSITEYRDLVRKDISISTLMSRLVTEAARNPGLKTTLLLEFVAPEEMKEYYSRNPDQFKAICQLDFVRLAFQFQTPEEREESLRLARSIRRRVEEEGAVLFYLAYAYMDLNLMLRSKEGIPVPKYENLIPEKSPFSSETTALLFKTLRKGDVSQPVVDGNTVNLFHLTDKIDEKERTFEEAQPFIRKQLEMAKRRRNQAILRDDLVRRSFVSPPDLFK
jgi:hypothetical protein